MGSLDWGEGRRGALSITHFQRTGASLGKLRPSIHITRPEWLFHRKAPICTGHRLQIDACPSLHSQVGEARKDQLNLACRSLARLPLLKLSFPNYLCFSGKYDRLFSLPSPIRSICKEESHLHATSLLVNSQLAKRSSRHTHRTLCRNRKYFLQ